MTPTHELISTRGKETNYFVGSEKEVEREKRKLGNDWKFEVKEINKK